LKANHEEKLTIISLRNNRLVQQECRIEMQQEDKKPTLLYKKSGAHEEKHDVRQLFCRKAKHETRQIQLRGQQPQENSTHGKFKPSTSQQPFDGTL